MNKAFVKEPEFDGKAYCPRCGALGTPVTTDPLDTHIRPEVRSRLAESAWFCGFARCEVAYFNLFEAVVTEHELLAPIYPKDPAAPICACFGFTFEEIEADVADGTPHRIRTLLAQSKTTAARCHTLAADGCCCLREVQRLYIKLRERQ